MGRAAARKKEPKYLDGRLDELLVVMPYSELGYSKYHMMLSTLPDYGYLLQTGRVLSQIGGYPHQNANDLFRAALQIKGWKRLLCLEHDHMYPADVFRRHAAYTEDIVGGMYFLRDVEGPLPVFYMWDEGRKNALNPSVEEVNKIITEPGMYKMDCVPLGCTSIRRDVLENWVEDQPFFSSFTNANGATISHDIFFCRLAQDRGYQPWLDSRISVGHLAQVTIDKDYFVRWWNAVGAGRAEKDAIKKSLKVIHPSDGTKKPKIIVCHTPGGLDPDTQTAVEATGLGVIYREMVNQDDYYLTFASLWAGGETFVSVEQDIVPAPGMIEEMLACSEPWCSFAHEYPPLGIYAAATSCGKFSRELVAAFPDAMMEIGKWSDPKHPSRHWCTVDGYLKQYLTEKGVDLHVHGVVEHHHKGKPAHDCLTEDDVAILKAQAVQGVAAS